MFNPVPDFLNNNKMSLNMMFLHTISVITLAGQGASKFSVLLKQRFMHNSIVNVKEIPSGVHPVQTNTTSRRYVARR